MKGPGMRPPTGRLSLLLRSGMVVLALLVGGCASKPSAPPAPAAVALGKYKYLIGAGDTLSVIVWRNPDLSMTIPVRPDGKVSLPLVEDLPVAGKDPVMVAREIEHALTRYIRDPVVTVVVTQFAGPYSEQVRVIGQATKPQALAYRENMTLLDVMIAVGGMTDFADGNRANILRTSEGNKLYRVRLDDLLRGGDISANVAVMPGDVVIIPESWF
ncbi:MAG TPA: XrtA/PEP-CTERM system exopolysaccharide export protein [Steroidobacteraceae bacterium]|nr:XrtA/PEP-CTERM system exopolysaccharide export protein [Steroidobacteraceae bacterium]